MFSGFSKGVADLLQSFWCKGTVNQYQPYLRRWKEHYSKHNIDPFGASISDGVEFLAHLFHNSTLEYSALNTARSALSTIIPEQNGLTFGKQPIVKRLLKGIFRERPTLPKYTITFDVDKVFHHLLSLPMPDTVTLKELSFRVATLMCILSGQRSQTLAFLSLDVYHATEKKNIFPITNLLKQSRPGFHQEPLKFSKVEEDTKLCPLSNINLYIEMTKSIRGTEKNFFISYVSPHKAVSSKTIARWVLSFLQDAGVDTTKFGSHSTRSASTSKALKVGTSIGEIGKAAGWSSNSTFAKYYNRPIVKNFGTNLIDNFLSN